MKLVVSCTLVRPRDKCSEADFGNLRKTPSTVAPAAIRFVIARIPDELGATARKWHGIIKGPADE